MESVVSMTSISAAGSALCSCATLIVTGRKRSNAVSCMPP